VALADGEGSGVGDRDGVGVVTVFALGLSGAGVVGEAARGVAVACATIVGPPSSEPASASKPAATATVRPAARNAASSHLELAIIFPCPFPCQTAEAG
jgi:hypothetical protein